MEGKESKSEQQNEARGEGASSGSVAACADPPQGQSSSGAQDVFPLMLLFDVAQGRIFNDICGYLPVEDRKSLSETNKQLFERYRKDWLGRDRRWIHARLKNSADVQGFTDLMGNTALGPFKYLRLDLHCELGREFAIDTDDTVHHLVCEFEPSFRGSYRDTFSKLSAAFPAVTKLVVDRVCRTEPFAESGADLSLSWNPSNLSVHHLPVSMFTTCSSSLTKLCYRLWDVPCDAIAMYAIPSALFDACKDTLVVMYVNGNRSSFEVCRMDDMVKLTKVSKLGLYDGATIAHLDMNRMPPTLVYLFHGGELLIRV